ncbi:MAG TPA: hypothetical protein VIG90_15520 [Pedomonas sp.]|uniref:hypothetical protein n=1 Tax=Pedomonas sp. TaxID=2976421 RepID=UPI002F429F24
MTLDELIAALEQATGPSRELDWQLSDYLGEIPAHSIRTVGFDYDWYRAPGGTALWRAKDGEGRLVELWEPKKRTASLDEALTLVPTDLAIIELVLGWDPSRPSVHPAAVVRWYPPNVAHDGKSWHAQIASAKTLPLTVCLASLQARRASA